MDLKLVRASSIQSAKRMGVEISPTLPLMESKSEARDRNKVAARMLAMHAVAAIAYGFERRSVIDWLNQEALSDSLSRLEKRFVFERVGQPDRFKIVVEAIWALAWTMGIANELNFAKDCDDKFVTQLPNLKNGQSSTDFREKIDPRPLDEIVSACDLAYCLHWSIRQSDSERKLSVGTLKPYVVIERRRALEWVLSNEEWDNVLLDT